jgi:hypothetical protein
MAPTVTLNQEIFRLQNLAFIYGYHLIIIIIVIIIIINNIIFLNLVFCTKGQGDLPFRLALPIF